MAGVMIFEGLFAVLVAAAIYPLAVYPLCVLMLSRLFPRRWAEAAVDEPVVHIITVHDESARIAAKLENALALDLPAGSETLVADDGSTDGGREVAAPYLARGVRWLDCPRGGKEHAQIAAIRNTTARILVFSDASTSLPPDAVRQLLRPFADPRVAVVSGTDLLAGDGESGIGEDLYVRFEMAVRRAESLVWSLVGVSGCFFAVRREVAEQLLPDVPSDLGAALIAIRSGQRAVAKDEAICRYAATPAASREFARKRRTALRGLRGLVAYPGVLSWSRPVASWQVISHKWMRFAIPLFGIGALAIVVAAAIAGRGWAAWFLALCSLGVMVALVSLLVRGLRGIRPLRAATFLVVSTAAVLAAWFDLVRGVKQATWTPTARGGMG